MMKRMPIVLLVVLLTSLIGLNSFTQSGNAAAVTSANFKDLSGLSDVDKKKIDALLQKGVFNGVSANQFGIQQNMNRAQFAKVASVVFGLKVDASLRTSKFTDVKATDPSNGYALPYIESVKNAGITAGVDAAGKLYNPSGLVTREQLAAFLIRGLGLADKAAATKPVQDSTVSTWARPYVALAIQNNIMTNENGKFNGTSSATRYTLAMAAYATLTYLKQVPPVDSTNSSPAAGFVSPEGKTMAVVGRTRSQGNPPEDQAIIKRMKELGFRTTWVDEATMTTDYLNGFDIVYFSPTLNRKFVYSNQMKDLKVPQVYGKLIGIQSLYLADPPPDLGSDYIPLSTSRSIDFRAPSSPIAEGLGSSIDIYKDVSSEAGMKQLFVLGVEVKALAKSAQVIAGPKGDPSKASVIAYEKGAKDNNGNPTKARIVCLLPSIGFQAQITADGYKLMDNAVIWALQN